eukprot:s2704_g4.t1
MLMLPTVPGAMSQCFPAPCKAVALGRRTRCLARCGLEPGQVVVPEPYSRWLLRSCTQFSLMTMGAAIHRRWGCCLLSTVVLFAGLNYWRKATFGWRRFCDMAAVTVTVLYHSCVAFGFLGHGLAADSPFALLCRSLHPRFRSNRLCFDDRLFRGHVPESEAFRSQTPGDLQCNCCGLLSVSPVVVANMV